MDRKFPRSFDSLGPIFAWVEDWFEQESIDPSLIYPVNFTLEELFTNMVKYSAGEAEILLSMDRVDGGVAVSLTDFGVEPFDVTRSKPVDIEAPLEERVPGGLGLHLIRKFVDGIHYDHRDGNSTIRFTARAEASDVHD